MKEEIALKCLNPHGVFKTMKPSGLTPRVDSLEDKKIGIFWDGKAGGNNFCAAVEELLNKRLPNTTTMRAEWNDVASAEQVKKEMDTFILAIADSGAAGWIWAQQVIAQEKLGIPGVFVISDVAYLYC
jgi:hypothetical protein